MPIAHGQPQEADKNAAREEAFYEQLSFCDVADVFRFVNEQCQFVLTLTAYRQVSVLVWLS